MVCAIIHVKVDWAEVAHTLGFPNWADGLRPCFLCNATAQDMQAHDGVDIDDLGSLPFQNNEEGDYDAACKRCEKYVVIISKAAHQAILKHLFFDKSKKGSRGYTLGKCIPDLGLLQGDRLEPCDALQDVRGFPKLARFPCSVMFWRRSQETICRHRNPLLLQRLGLDPCRCLRGDLLHILYLGVMLAHCACVLWTVLRHDLWGHFSTVEERVQNNLSATTSALKLWYKDYRKANPSDVLTQVQAITPKMIGDESKRKLKTKGGETWGILLFLNHFLREHLRRLPVGAVPMLEAGLALERFVYVLKSQGVNMTLSARKECLRLWKLYMSLTSDLAELHIPKRHAWLHLILNMHYSGNPVFFACWLDEALNKVFKGACQGISQATFDASVLQRMPSVLDRALNRKST